MVGFHPIRELIDVEIEDAWLCAVLASPNLLALDQLLKLGIAPRHRPPLQPRR